MKGSRTARSHGRGPAAGAALEPWHRRSVYAVLAVLAASGILWLAFHYYMRTPTEWGEGPHPLEPWWLRVHGLAAMLTLFALGSLLPTHMRHAWHLGRNRPTGTVLAAAFGLLTATGYALYYFAGERSRPYISLCHWLLGLLLVALVAAHVWRGRDLRRRRARRPRTPQRRAEAHVAADLTLHLDAGDCAPLTPPAADVR